MATEALAVQEHKDTLLTVIERAVMSPDFDVQKLKELLEVRDRWEKNEARKAFVQAMADFKAEPLVIMRDKKNSQYGSNYTSIGNLVNTVTPILSKHGLSARWDIDQAGGIKVSCILTHALGHSETIYMVVPPDKSGAKNPLQEIKSAITYARICTYESILGLASTDPMVNPDDDANGAASNGELAEQIEWLANAKDTEELFRLFKAAYNKFKGNKAAVNALSAAKDAKKKELFNANR